MILASPRPELAMTRTLVRSVGQIATTAVGVAAFATSLAAQQPAVARIVAEPAQINVRAGDSVAFKVTAYDAQGKVITDAGVRVGGPRLGVAFSDGWAKGIGAGKFTAVATTLPAPGAPSVTLEIPVTVTWPPLT